MSKTTKTSTSSARKQPSFSALAAAAAYGEVIKTVKMQSVQTFAAEEVRPPLRAYGPWENQKASTANLRSKRKRPENDTSHTKLKITPFRPGLELSGLQLETSTTDSLLVREVVLFPTTLAMIKANHPFTFSLNLTPQLAPPLPASIAEDLYSRYVCSSPLLSPGKLPYLHLGSTTLAFRLNFYLILPNAGGTPHASNTGHLSDESLQLIFDYTIIPALQTADPTRKGYTSWLQAMNESNLKTLKSRHRTTSTTPSPLEERIHCLHLNQLWNSIDTCADERVSHLLEGKIFIAYGCRDEHPWHEEWKCTWEGFKRDWEGAVDVGKLKGESRVKLEMECGLEGLEERDKAEREREREVRKRIRR